MKGRDTFTREEADRIRATLDQKQRADGAKKKTLRNKLRQRLHFYITDFSASPDEFTRSDFDELVRRGVIKIVNGSTSAALPPRSTPPAPLPAPARAAVDRFVSRPPGLVRALSVPNAQRPDGTLPEAPGLYAFHGSVRIWRELGLGDPPDDRPLYVGKAQDSITKRVAGTHLRTGRTGQSTVRRTFAALLADKLHLAACPRNLAKPGRFANYALLPDGDERLTAWMLQYLRVSSCPIDETLTIPSVESQVLQHWLPPLNLSDLTTPWKPFVSAARARLAKQAASAA